MTLLRMIQRLIIFSNKAHTAAPWDLRIVQRQNVPSLFLGSGTWMTVGENTQERHGHPFPNEVFYLQVNMIKSSQVEQFHGAQRNFAAQRLLGQGARKTGLATLKPNAAEPKCTILLITSSLSRCILASISLHRHRQEFSRKLKTMFTDWCLT